MYSLADLNISHCPQATQVNRLNYINLSLANQNEININYSCQMVVPYK